MLSVFTYPGSKIKLAARIVSIFPPTGDRYVDVFSGRGALVFELMRRGGYQRYWINAVGTIDFFKELRWLGPAPAVGPILFKTKTKEYYNQSKAETLRTSLENTVIPEIERLGTHVVLNGQKIPILDMMKRALATAGEESLSRPASAAVEAYNSYMGGTYHSTGFKPQLGNGGISRDGMRRKFIQAGLMLEENWKRIKLTAIDYRDALAQCRPGDMVYL